MSGTETANAVSFEGVCPILPVSDIDASLDYYVRLLGFKIDWREGGFASVTRGGCHIFLCEGEQGHPGTWVWIGVGDAEAVHNEYVAKGARIRHPPTNYTWAFEMQVEDLDGNVLRMGSDQKTDQAVGEWLDMHGVRWAMSENGTWSRV